MDELKKHMYHSVVLENRNKLTVSGITDVGSFNEECMILYSDEGEITIKGEELQVSVLNVDTGEFSAQGKIASINYSDKKMKNPGFFARVFR